MAGDTDTRELEENEAPERAIDPVLLNALADALAGGEALADEESRSLVRNVAEAATTEAEREAFAAAVGRVAAGGQGSEEDRDAIEAVVDPVRDALAAEGARVVVDHETPIPVEADEAAVYDFATNRDPSTLAKLDLPEAAAEDVREGGEYVASGDYEAAAEAFTRAVDRVGTGEGAVTTRTLAALAHHWAGDDHGAIDFVEEAMHLHADAWIPTIAGHAADPDESFARSPQFREGKYAAMATLRYTVDCPESTIITPFVGYSNGDDGDREWVELDGTDECTPIDRLGSDPVLRLRLGGRVPAFPAMHSYYVGIGVVDREVTEMRAVYRLLVNGPLGETVTETIRLETDD